MKPGPSRHILLCAALASLILFFPGPCPAGNGPATAKERVAELREQGETDPWKLLRAIYLPFTMEEEKRANWDARTAKQFAKKLNSRLVPYNTFIACASKTFDIPQEVIKAVIMVESAGNARARAKTSSAKGLMQTINSTFSMARKGLVAQGIQIKNDPFDPEASIMAGAWYLNRMYEKCIRDGRVLAGDRFRISSWEYPAQYYYAGPVNGAKAENKILVFSNGKKRTIDKRAYSQKVAKWAKIIAI